MTTASAVRRLSLVLADYLSLDQDLSERWTLRQRRAETEAQAAAQLD